MSKYIYLYIRSYVSFLQKTENWLVTVIVVFLHTYIINSICTQLFTNKNKNVNVFMLLYNTEFVKNDVNVLNITDKVAMRFDNMYYNNNNMTNEWCCRYKFKH